MASESGEHPSVRRPNPSKLTLIRFPASANGAAKSSSPKRERRARSRTCASAPCTTCPSASRSRRASCPQANDDILSAVWPISELPAADVDTLVGLCRDLWTTTILATLATPETLESPLPIARTYEEVHKLAMDSWTMCEPYIRDDIEDAQFLRRCVLAGAGRKWWLMNARQVHRAEVVRPGAAKARESSFGQADRSSAGRRVGRSAHPNRWQAARGLHSRRVRRALRPVAASRMLDLTLQFSQMQGGSLFLPFTMPTGTGETFESTTILLQTLHKRVRGDLDAANQRRRARGAHDFPPLTEAWTMRACYPEHFSGPVLTFESAQGCTRRRRGSSRGEGIS